MIFDLDSRVVTVFGRQQKAEVGYNPRYRGKRSYDPLLSWKPTPPICGYQTAARQRWHMGWQRSELLASCFVNLPPDVRELRVRADAGFGFNPVLEILEARAAQYAVVARLTPSIQAIASRLTI